MNNIQFVTFCAPKEADITRTKTFSYKNIIYSYTRYVGELPEVAEVGDTVVRTPQQWYTYFQDAWHLAVFETNHPIFLTQIKLDSTCEWKSRRMISKVKHEEHAADYIGLTKGPLVRNLTTDGQHCAERETSVKYQLAKRWQAAIVYPLSSRMATMEVVKISFWSYGPPDGGTLVKPWTPGHKIVGLLNIASTNEGIMGCKINWDYLVQHLLGPGVVFGPNYEIFSPDQLKAQFPAKDPN
ncbi:hypothetical protein B0H13DRAFT_1930870 [Mycena leptocephala]|nr:hypothetical protein B0H13DRAFT_1930870 [Mycena leptocephala]